MSTALLRAIDALKDLPEETFGGTLFDPDYARIVRVVVEAIRDPDPTIIARISRLGLRPDFMENTPAGHWYSLIDEILK